MRALLLSMILAGTIASAQMKQVGDWHLMYDGTLFITDIQQSGPRGGDKLFSTDYFMLSGMRPLGGGTLTLSSMLSLDPATVTERRYPLLFQTGETAFGKSIIDGQHPHDLFMELGIGYSHSIGAGTTLHLYFAPSGAPALGPVGFSHRESAAEIPQAVIGHHLQDSTHIANEVVTVGLSRGMFKVEASGFHGAEPNENRWNIDYGKIDSWAGRVWFNPTSNWSAQVSLGRLSHPEADELGDIVRSTASVSYKRGGWASTVIWGRNHKIAEQRNINSYLAESVWKFRARNYVSGRAELVDKDELTIPGTYRIGAYTMGYTRDIPVFEKWETGLGANFTAYSTPSAIKPVYGDHPIGVAMFLRIRHKGGGMGHMHH